MKKIIFSVAVMAFVLVSCNQKNKEENTVTTVETDTVKDTDATMMDHSKMENHEKMYACPMHPEVQGKLNDKCSKCGMDLTEPVPEKAEESK